VNSQVASVTESNEVFIGVKTAMAAKHFVMHFKSTHGSAELAAPRIPN